MALPNRPRVAVGDTNPNNRRVWEQWFDAAKTRIDAADSAIMDINGRIEVDAPPGNVVIVSDDGAGFKDSGKNQPTGQFVGTTGAQTLTNKTLTSPILNSPTLTGQTGSFTLGAAVDTTVANTKVTASSHVGLTPMNAAATALMNSAKHLYVSARTAGVSFVVSTGNGVAAAGTEDFSYSIMN